MIWTCGTYQFDSHTPTIMGVLNMTPDSFSDGGLHPDTETALAHARQMMAQGARIIDVGGESTRPGAEPVTPDEEWNRVGAVIRQLAAEDVCVSVDTRHAEVAARAVEAGASIVNDVSGFRDPAMVRVAAGADVGVVVMHMQGEPATMQDDPHYDDVVAEVCAYLGEQAAMLEAAGVARSRICVDPGPGFGKTQSQTVELMRNLHEVRHLGYPVMCAVSRKSFITGAYQLDPEDLLARDAASANEALLAAELGASVIRTHNVEATAQALKALKPYVLLSLGSNVALVAEPGEETEAKEAQINLAIGKLCQLPDSLLIDGAPFYLSRAAYKEDQDDFVNTAVLLRTGLPPRELLQCLHAIEDMLGRVRTEPNGPRTLDIDIVDYQMYSYATDDLVLPHPCAIERDFVVRPSEDILPGHVLADGRRMAELPAEKRLGAAERL